ncbi:glycosyltransferase [Lyngbya aestuarii]|uniref:glycosyltransferase n=1 Tax=Lyngbya aestuarii TaxID=118322 RepID=UPI00403D690E
MNLSIPLVSVIIPAYNAAQFLAEAIESVISQTFTDWELLVIDDGSTDSTASLVQRYSQQDYRVRLFSQVNQGVSYTRNLGVEMTQGKFIAFLDADDRWLPDKLAVQIKFLNERSDVGISFGRVKFISYDGNFTGQFSTGRLTEIKPEYLLYENPTTTTSNWVVRREVFQCCGGLDQSMSYSEDVDWLFRVMLKKQWQIEGIDQILMCYRTNSTGLSSELYRMEDGWNLLISKAMNQAPELVSKHYSLAKAVHLRYFARRAIRLKLPSQVGVSFVNRALQSDWRLLFKEPRRTLLTVVAAYVVHLMQSLNLTKKSVEA